MNCKNKYKLIIFLVIIVLSTIVIYEYTGTKNTKKYTYEELNILDQNEVYKVFLNNGLKVDEEIKKTLTDERIAYMLKSEFDLLIQGVSPRSHSMYLNFAKEVKKTYEKLTYNK